MTSLYVRWVALFIVAVILGILIYDHYQKNLAAWVPSQVQTQQPTQQPTLSPTQQPTQQPTKQPVSLFGRYSLIQFELH